MIEVAVRNGFAIVDAEDVHLLVGAAAFLDGMGYVAGKFGGKRGRLHRAVTGAKPGEIVDHVNQVRNDCRRANLRITDRTGNAQNTVLLRRHNTSGYRGVSLCKQTNRWRAGIQAAGKRKKLGRFDDPIAAAEAYDEAARKQHGAFAVLNFPKAGK